MAHHHRSLGTPEPSLCPFQAGGRPRAGSSRLGEMVDDVDELPADHGRPPRACATHAAPAAWPGGALRRRPAALGSRGGGAAPVCALAALERGGITVGVRLCDCAAGLSEATVSEVVGRQMQARGVELSTKLSEQLAEQRDSASAALMAEVSRSACQGL